MDVPEEAAATIFSAVFHFLTYIFE